MLDQSSNLYGTTQIGGVDDRGVAYELRRQGRANWVETVLYSFTSQDGAAAPIAGVIMDPSGNLYGTADSIYELSPAAGGWTFDPLHEFCTEEDGCGPIAGVIFDVNGNLYGTTNDGGTGGWGTAYKLTPEPGGWQEQILHNFPSFQTDGQRPGAGNLAMDPAGNLYGTTGQGGANICGEVGCGTIFRLTPGTNGQWQEAILYNFSPKRNGALGESPEAGVVLDRNGNLYGTANIGGGAGCGVVYKLALAAKGRWEYTVLHSFTGYDGCYPHANLIFNSKGNLYGTTTIGGAYGLGVAFELTP